MRICPYCGKENRKEKYFCENCGSYMGSHYAVGHPPVASPAAKAQMDKEANSTTTKRKPRKTTEYVQLYHGPKVKKSTARWLERKQEDASRWLFVIIGLGLLLALIKGCS
jgi:hypothetical protein